jgi:ADP-ribose pyrophosphatase YjhB (NUDIX family)
MRLKNIEIKIFPGDMIQPCQTVRISPEAQTDEKSVRQAAAGLLQSAQKSKDQQLAFNCDNFGSGGVTVAGISKIMVQEILKVARQPETSIREIIFYRLGGENFQVFERSVSGYVKHIVEILGPGPYMTADIIIELEEGIIVIERSNPPLGWALPGGFLDYGESLEDCARREAKEETNMDLEDLRQFHIYSDPARDPRFHTLSTVFIAKGKGTPQFGDDAKGLRVVKYRDLLNFEYAFDHKQIIRDYLALRVAPRDKS